MSQESYVTVPPDSAGKRLRALNYTLSGQNAAQSVWSEVINIGDPQSGAYLALVNASGALSVSTSGDAVSVSGNIVGVYAASQQSGWMAVVSGVQATSGALTVSSSGLATVAISSGGVVPVLAASFQSGWAAVVSGVGATSGQLNVASSGIGAVAIASGGIIPISIISGNVVALSGIVEIVSGQTVTVVSSGIGTIAVSSGGVIPTILASAQSGGLVGISGGGLTISGGVTISGLVGISGGALTVSGSVQVSGSVGLQVLGSGNTLLSVGYASGVTTGYIPIGGASGVALGVTVSGLVGISGGGLTVSGGVTISGLVVISGFVAISGSVTVLPNAYQSGQLVALSGGGAGISGATVSVSGDVIVVGTSGSVNVVIAGSGGNAIYAQTNIGTTSDNLQGSVTALAVEAFPVFFEGTNWARGRSIIGSSGSSTGVLAIQQVGYSYTLVSGATFVNAKAGALYLHSININSYSSGGQFEVRDSASGVVGAILGAVSPTLGGLTNTDLSPASLVYDALLTSGLVISTSGTNWNLTALWRAA